MVRQKRALKGVVLLAGWLLIALFSIGPGYCQTHWADTYGGSSGDRSYAVQQTTDLGYIVAGHTQSFGAGLYDIWVVKLNANGSVAWEKTYGGNADDKAYAVQQTTDGGYIVAGYTVPEDSERADLWVLKLNANGSLAWDKTYGGGDDDYGLAIRQTTDLGYIVAGYTYSYGAGSDDLWVLKLTSSGAVSWANTYGGSSGDRAYAVQQTTDLGYIVAGYTQSFGAGNDDLWVLKLTSSGTVSWENTYGNSNWERAYAVQQTTDLGYIVAGYTDPYDTGSADFLVLKLTASGTVSWENTYAVAGGDIAYDIQQTTDLGYIVAGYTDPYGAGNADFQVLKLTAGGTVSWAKTYGGSDDDYGLSIRQANDLGYIMAGYTYSNGAGDSDSWVLKLDNSGTIADCDLIASSTATLTSNPVSAVSSSAVMNTSSASIGHTSATVTDTSADTDTICFDNIVSAGTGTVGPEDIDSDGIPDNTDNCPATPNGPLLGTCSFTGGSVVEMQCTSDSQCTICAYTGICSMDQDDADADGIGDVCDN